MLGRLTLGGIAFALVLAVLKRLDGLFEDLDRYNKLREISGEPPLINELIMQLPLVEYIAAGRGEAISVLKSIRDDLQRYVRIANM
jgi:hypothetical protein